MTLTPWQPEPPARDVVDGWVPQVIAVRELAEVIAGTDFVPRAYRGQPAAVAAAILAGRELGIGPMTALQHLHVIDGRPAMSAQLMRALVLAHGHTLRITEATSTRATIVGRRNGESAEYPVTWTMDDARAAKIAGRPSWSTYPRAMLLARATGELCRGIFPDVIGGMAYTLEEAADIEPAGEAAARSTGRTVRRARTVEAPAGAPPPQIPPATDAPSPAVTSPGPSVAEGEGNRLVPSTLPPLPEGPASAVQPQNGPLTPASPEEAQGDPEPENDGQRQLTSAQRANLFAQLAALGYPNTKPERLHVVSGLLSRNVSSFNAITRAEASALIDTLARANEEAITRAQLDALVILGWEAIKDG